MRHSHITAHIARPQSGRVSPYIRKRPNPTPHDRAGCTVCAPSARSRSSAGRPFWLANTTPLNLPAHVLSMPQIARHSSKRDANTYSGPQACTSAHGCGVAYKSPLLLAPRLRPSCLGATPPLGRAASPPLSVRPSHRHHHAATTLIPSRTNTRSRRPMTPSPHITRRTHHTTKPSPPSPTLPRHAAPLAHRPPTRTTPTS